MSTIAPTDDTQDYDPLVLADQDDETDELEDASALPVADDLPTPELPPELEAEIHKVIVPEAEEAPAKVKQMIPQHVIDKELTADDLMDYGSL